MSLKTSITIHRHETTEDPSTQTQTQIEITTNSRINLTETLNSISWSHFYLHRRYSLLPMPAQPSSPSSLAEPSHPCPHKPKSKPNLQFKQTNWEPKKKKIKKLDLSRRCSGVKPSSLFFPLPVRAAARSRSRSLWFPREDPSQGKPKQTKSIQTITYKELTK